jgi:hypothetical protein
MNTPYGGMTIAANTTVTIAGGTAAKHTQGWAAHGVSRHGALDVTPDVDNSRLTLKAGVYRVVGQMSVEFEDFSGTSGDDAGRCELKIYAAGSAVSGAAGEFDMVDSDRPQTVTIEDIIEITAAQVVAATNYVELYWDATDASGNDITVKNGKLLAYRLS